MIKKKDISQISKIQKSFYDYITANNNNNINEYNELSRLYKKIKEYYLNKLKNKNFEIRIEKIRLEKNLGIYSGLITNYNIAVFAGMIGTLFPFLSQLIGFNFKGNFIIFIFGYLILLYGLIKPMGRSFVKDRDKEIMMYLCLKVLEDIEKEMQQDSVLEEVSCTEEKNDKKSEKSKIIGLINIFNDKK